MANPDAENTSEIRKFEVNTSQSVQKNMIANIRTCMTQLGINQKQLAERAGLSESVLSNYFSGRNGARKDNLNKIALALGVSAEQLLLPWATDTALVRESVVEYRLLGKYTDFLSEGVELPFIPYSAYGGFVAGCQDRHRNGDEFDWRWVKKIPGKRYDNAYLLEIRGNSMAPRYPDGARYVVRSVSDGNWQYAQGVHAISLKGDGEGDAKFVIKRITSNINGVLLLSSDNNNQEMAVALDDIMCMWKVGEADYLPEEE